MPKLTFSSERASEFSLTQAGLYEALSYWRLSFEELQNTILSGGHPAGPLLPEDQDRLLDLTASIDVDRLLRCGTKELQVHIAYSFYCLFNRDKDARYLDRCIALFEHAVPLFSDDDSRKSGLLGYHGLALSLKGSTENAIRAFEGCVEFATDISSGLPHYLLKLADLLPNRSPGGSSLALADLERAIWCTEMALALASENNGSLYMMCWRYLANLLHMRHIRFGGFTDLARGISAAERVVDACPSDPTALSMLGNILSSSYDQTRNLVEIDRSISVLKQSLDLQADKQDYMTIFFLARSLRLRFRSVGEPSDFYLALEYSETSTALSSSGPTVELVLQASQNFAQLLNDAYVFFGDITYSDRAVSAYESLLQLIPDHHPDTHHYLGDFTHLLTTRIERNTTADKPLLVKKMIHLLQEAVDRVPYDHPSRPVHLNRLGLALQLDLQLTPERASISSIERLISIHKEAFATSHIPDWHASKAMYLNYLGGALYFASDMMLTLQYSPSSLASILDAHASNVAQLYTGHSSAATFTGDVSSHLGRPIFILRESMDAFRRSARMDIGDAEFRFHSATHWATAATVLGDQHGLLEAYNRAMELVPHLAWFGGSIVQQHKRIMRVPLSEIGRKAASLATILPKYHADIVLTWLEQCRSVVWGQILKLRTPTDDLLCLYHPELARKMEKVSRDMVDLGARLHQQTIAWQAHTSLEKYHRLAEEREALVAQVRSKPGFQGFLKPKQLLDLRAAATGGPVVVLNVSGDTCQALIIMDEGTHGSLHVLPLEEFTEELANALQSKLRLALQSPNLRSRGAGERGARRRLPPDLFPHILSILWRKIVKPVLDSLKIQTGEWFHDHSDGSDPPRITWCPTAPLAFLPLHAAGLYDTEEPGSKVYDYVASSYTPSLSILEHIYKSRPTHAEHRGLFMASLPFTPGQTPIPKTEDEVSSILQAAVENGHPIDGEWLNGAEATKEAVLAGMKSHSWVHLACHASQRPFQPTESAFMLADGPLSLAEIVAYPLPHAEFAFLSACQTATGDEQLAEEAVHLAAGMLTAGYRSVIATMWSVRDEDAPLVADAVYRKMFEGGRINCDGTGFILHRATRMLREKAGETDFLSWVPFIHVGV